jgi:hypothetical protein
MEQTNSIPEALNHGTSEQSPAEVTPAEQPTTEQPPAEQPLAEEAKKKRKRKGSGGIGPKRKQGAKDKNNIPKPKTALETRPERKKKEITKKKVEDDFVAIPWQGCRERLVQAEISRRLCIAYIYEHKLQAPEPSEWDGIGGTISTIKKTLGIPRGSNIKAIVMAAYKSIQDDTVYTGEAKHGEGSSVVLETEGPEAQIVARAMEDGMSITKSHELLNELLREQGKDIVSRDAVYSLRLRLKLKPAPDGTPVQK